MKKLLLVSILTSIIILSGCTNNYNNSNIQSNQTKQNTHITNTKKIDNTTSKQTKYFTLDEVKKHNIPGKDCRTIISGKVYDITSFFGIHPGGNDKIAQLCGKDGTDKFIKKHGKNEKAINKLKTFYIGEVK